MTQYINSDIEICQSPSSAYPVHGISVYSVEFIYEMPKITFTDTNYIRLRSKIHVWNEAHRDIRIIDITYSRINAKEPGPTRRIVEIVYEETNEDNSI